MNQFDLPACRVVSCSAPLCPGGSEEGGVRYSVAQLMADFVTVEGWLDSEGNDFLRQDGLGYMTNWHRKPGKSHPAKY